MRKTWERYRRGDHITGGELLALIDDTEVALRALVYRSDFGVVTRVLAQDLSSLEGFANTRCGTPLWRKKLTTEAKV